ncbi:MAG: AAA family ATPase, partial [Blastocatellia bacterium]
PTTLWSLWRIRLQPQHAARFLKHSLAYWDELFRFPQPLLARLVVAAGEQDAKAGKEAIEHLLTNTLQQKVAENALIELESRALLRCDTVEKIAARGTETNWFAAAPDPEWLGRAVAVFAQCEKAASEIAAAVASTSNYQKLASFHRARRQLDELTKASLGMRGKHRQNFARIAQLWSGAVNAEIDRLTREEQVAERIPNPFIANTALAAGSDTFLGRTAAYRFVEEHFLRPGQTATIVLYGQPRIGKSSFLRNLRGRLTTDLIPVYVDMQSAAQVESAGGLLFNLGQAISRELAARGVAMKTPSLNDYAVEPFIVFNRFLDQAESAIGAPANRMILALDEFEEIEKKLTQGRISADLMPFLRGVMQHRAGVSLLFAGTHTLDEMISELWTPYFRSAVPCRVSYLDEVSARKLITQPIEDFALNYEAEAVDLLIRETRCHPCLIQLACLSLVDLKNEQQSRLATIEDVRRALALALENGDYAFQGIWEWIPAKERPLLALLASNEPASVEEMARRLSKPEAETLGMAERLTEAEVIGREGNEPRYRFQVPLFRQWVARYAVLKGMDFGKRQAAD